MEQIFEPDSVIIPDPLNDTAQQRFGINYLFPFQRLVISNIIEADTALSEKNNAGTSDSENIADPLSKQIVILPTGAGKSLCFMLPAILLKGPTIVIFPLLSLIADQLRRCEEAGIEAASLTGGQSNSERNGIFEKLDNGSLKILLTNPETALSPAVIPRLKKSGFRHLVFDEVHTVSEWGDSFRPAYLESRRIYEEAGIPIVTAFTATASESVLNRVKEVLFPDENPHIVTANPDRPNISYTVLPSICKTGSLERLLKQNTAEGPDAPAVEIKRPALVFCSTRKTAEKTALQLRLRLNDERIFFYHAGLDKSEKKAVEDWFFKSADGILCATCAYGMGIDKPDIRTVIHFDLSPSVEAYLQESGRAGRDREQAEAILLISPSDRSTALRRITTKDAADRYRALLQFAENSETCRRESLMRLLGAEPDTCFGCDVCRKTVQTTAYRHDEIAALVRRNKRVLTTAAASKMLSSKFMELSGTDASEMLEELMQAGVIRRIRRGPWKRYLTC